MLVNYENLTILVSESGQSSYSDEERNFKIKLLQDKFPDKLNNNELAVFLFVLAQVPLAGQRRQLGLSTVPPFGKIYTDLLAPAIFSLLRNADIVNNFLLINLYLIHIICRSMHM